MVIESVKNGPWRSWQVAFSSEPGTSFDEPSVDLLMQSAAAVAGQRAMGVVLTGLGNDGTAGARAIRQNGGRILVQNEESAAVFSMPNSVIQAGHADAVLSLEQIANAINRIGSRVASSPYSVPTLQTLLR